MLLPKKIGSEPAAARSDAAEFLNYREVGFGPTCSLTALPRRGQGSPYFGAGSSIAAFSANVASPVLPLIRYCIFNCLTTPGAGSPPKLSL